MQIESFEDSQRGGFFRFDQNEGKHVFVEFLAYEAEYETQRFGKQPSVNVNLVALEEDGRFTEYNNQWIRGAAIVAFFMGSKSGTIKPKDRGWAGVVKINHLPPRPGSDRGSWAFASPSRDEYNKLVQYVSERENAVDKAVEEAAASGSDPWD